MDDHDLTNLAAAYQAGDRGAFQVLVDSLSRSLIAVAYRYTRDWETARDLTQDTWIKVHRSIDRFDPGRPFGAWLHVIHRNTCLSHLRRARVQLETPMDPDTLSKLDGAVVGNPAADDNADFFSRLFRAVGQLSESQRQVFCRVDVEQTDQREAAEMLGIKFTTLRSTLHFARRKLARILKDMEEAT